MSWAITGRDQPIDIFGSFEPIEVLYDFDGPRIFTLATADSTIADLLAYQCGESETVLRYVVVPSNQELITSLQTGCITVREALSQPWVWVVDVSNDGRPISAKRTSLKAIPDKALPRQGTMLLPSLTPLLGVRMVGPSLAAGILPASVIRRAIDGALSALKTLGESALQAEPASGRPADWLRRYYDLPARRVAFASFEISFGEPSPTEQEELFHKSVLSRMGTLLQHGLSWAASADDSSIAQDSSVSLDAVAALAPPQHGTVTEVHVSGRLVDASARPYVLTRSSAKKIRRALANVRADLQPVRYIGYVREFDKDKYTFSLRDMAGSSVRCSVNERFYDDALDAFEQEYRVAVLGHESNARQIVEVVSIRQTAE